MAIGWAASARARSRPRIYCVVGDGGKERLRRLRARDDVALVSSPRHAQVMLITGSLPDELWPSAQQLHDQIPQPRLTAIWGPAAPAGPFAGIPVIADDEDVGAAVTAMYRDMHCAEQATRPVFGPKANPVKWRGVGPHGQGGEGMMGGTPYGRPMAMTDSDVRDGLALDQLQVTLGPFLPWLPAGLRLDLVMQGDVVQSASARVPFLRQLDWPAEMMAARERPIAVTDIEMARARHHLGALSDVLAVLGQRAMAERVARLAAELHPGQAAEVRRLARRLRTFGILAVATRSVGVLGKDPVRGTGCNARAAGIDGDARANDPAYAGLGFEPVVHERGDVEARIEQRVAEAVQAIELADRAAGRIREPGPILEGPRGPVGAIVGDADRFSPSGNAAATMLEGFLAWAQGRAFDELATTLVSLDLDPATLAHSPCFQQSEREHPCPR